MLEICGKTKKTISNSLKINVMLRHLFVCRAVQLTRPSIKIITWEFCAVCLKRFPETGKNCGWCWIMKMDIPTVKLLFVSLNKRSTIMTPQAPYLPDVPQCYFYIFKWLKFSFRCQFFEFINWGIRMENAESLKEEMFREWEKKKTKTLNFPRLM